MLDGKKTLFSGMQATGNLTLGNYLGALKNWVTISDDYQTFFSVVDMHSITVRQDPAELRKRARTLLTLYIAAGLDPEKNCIYYQSHVSGHAELAWILNCFTYMGELNRMTQFKDKAAKHADNINAGTYTLARPFNIVTGDSVSEVAQDFINYIMSEDGQKIISDNGYIEVENTGSFTSSKVKGSIVVAGSSSVTPVMEKLKEAYAKVNSNASIEIQESDSTTGVNSAIEGTCDIGMASRDLKDEEKGVKATAIAKDGIAVIVNNNNTIDDLTVDQIKENVKSAELELDPEDVAYMRELAEEIDK